MGAHIDIDPRLLAEAMTAVGLESGKATVEEALRELILDRRRRRAIAESAGIGWEGDLDAMREGRASDPHP